MAYSTTSMQMALLQALTSILLLFASSSILLAVQAGSAAESTTSAGTYRFELTHVDANRGFTREELIRRSAARAKLRAAMLSSDDSGLNTHAKYISSAEYAPQEYLMELQIGKPPKTTVEPPAPLTFKAVADTGSELVWTSKLDNCRCEASSTFARWSCSHPDAVRNPEHGRVLCGRCNDEKRTAAAEEYSCSGPCMFKKRYGGGNTLGFMATEELTLRAAGETVSLDLGCAVDWSDKMLPDSADGIAGLNRGHLSLVNQLVAKKFAYCLSDRLDENAPSSQLLFYDDESDLELISDGGSIQSLQTTPLVDAVDEHQNLVGRFMYHVQLDGISIDGNMKHKSLPEKSFKRKSAAKSGGPANVKPEPKPEPKPKPGVMFVDSGTSQTFLEEGVFEKLMELLLTDNKDQLEAVKHEEEENKCFRAVNSTWRPEMVFYFPGAEMRLPWANYMAEKKTAGPGVFCLTIHEDKQQSILGNFQLQNMHMLFDLTNEKLQFALHKDCSGLAVKKN